MMNNENIDFFDYLQYLDRKENEYRERYRGFTRCKVRFDGSHYVASPMEVVIPVDFSKYRYYEDGIEESQHYEIGKAPVKEIEENFIESYALKYGSKKRRRGGRKSEEENPFAYLFEGQEQSFDEYKEKYERERIIKLNMERRRRFRLKAFNNDFNYFCTFTYSDQILYELLTKKDWPKGSKGDYVRFFDEGRKWCLENRLFIEEAFRKKLKKVLQGNSTSLGWTYMGIFERGDKSERLHFHCLANIPDASVLGDMYQDDYFSFESRQREISTISPTYSKKLGRANFEFINGKDVNFLRSLNYILAYIGKGDNQIIYSRRLKDFKYADLPFGAYKIFCPDRYAVGSKWWLLGDGVTNKLEFVRT